MRYFKLGDSDMKVSELSLGSDQASRIVDKKQKDQFIAAVKRGVELGINLFDSAEVYGGGKAEEVLGEALKGVRDKVYIASKVFRTNLRYNDVLISCEGSLRRLGVDYIDLYFVHMPGEDMQISETMEALCKLKQDGKIHSIGLSNFTKDEIVAALKYGRIDVLQSGYNPLWRKMETDIIPFCIEKNIGINPYSPLSQGMLTGQLNRDTVLGDDDFRKRMLMFQPEWYGKCIDIVEKMRPLSEKYGKTLAQITLNWITLQPGVKSVLIGCETPQQVEENVNSVNFRLSDEDVAYIREISQDLINELPDWRSVWFK